MARTAQKVESLIAEDAAMADALSVVYEHTDEGSDEVEWSDVSDDITSGQWGRMIEKGILVDGDRGFELADPDAVGSALDGSSGGTTSTSSTDVDDVEGTTWSKWDKLAAVASIGLFAGYSINSVRNVVGGAVDVFLGPVESTLPFYVVIMILAMLTGLYSTLLQDNLMNMEKMGAYQERMKDIQKRQKEAKERGDEQAMERIREEQMEAMGDQAGMFKEQFRPMVWTMFITIPVFLWMYWRISDKTGSVLPTKIVLPFVGEAGWQTGVIGPMQAWIVWYFLCSMAFTQLIRKALNIQTTPT
ncbi:DUF106 domain-containing protein [Haladaptatus caseinilyticus]|uniref:DUF106 domain-containing protein n=1 Tax=Haladaptatus caseinilyticus TaxID=2993314 RepID=UPI00224B6C2B|nr:DUF106 domain-containing protein [Haladaptatus caseinilyticus]